MPRLAARPLVHEPDPRHPVLGGGLGPYAHAVIGEPGGLTQFGVHLEVLPSGSRSSFRHWHAAEDEMIYLIAGELVLIEEEESLLRPGDAACWPAGKPVGHCLENRSAVEARYLVVGTRGAADVIHYPDHGLITEREGTKRRYLRPDGLDHTERSFS
ncbi:MAG: cupin domain-containing protein [Pararhodobacter sp.]